MSGTNPYCKKSAAGGECYVGVGVGVVAGLLFRETVSVRLSSLGEWSSEVVATGRMSSPKKKCEKLVILI